MEQQGSMIAVFCCYAREDEGLLNELRMHLVPFQRRNVINVWYDGNISAGTEWELEIKKHLDEAHIILLLISPDFISSDYCYDTEMKHAMARHERKEAIVIPVIVCPVAWQGTTIGNSTLGRLQALPKSAKPITTWKNRNEAWMDVVEGVERVVNKLLRESPPQSLSSSPSPLKKPSDTNSSVAGQSLSESVGGTNRLEIASVNTSRYEIPLESIYAPRHVLVHFLDHEIFYTFRLNQKSQRRVESEFKFAFRVALLLASDDVILPASHFFESPLAKQLLQQHRIFAEFGYISLASSTLDVSDFLQQKQQQYYVELDRYPLYFKSTPSSVEAESLARWILKTRNSTKDITTNWVQSIGDPQIWERVYDHSRAPSVSAFENDLARVPEKLQSNAFIADFVTPLLPIKEEVREVTENYINILIQRAYIDSFLKTYNAACLDDFSIFDTSVLLPTDRPHYSISRAKRYFLMQNKLLDFVMSATASQLLHYKLSEQWRSQLDIFITYTEVREHTHTPKQQEFE